MDESVLRAMAKWPKVPAAYGWLSLDRRGRWRLQERPITHPRTIEFINRNYLADEHGRWLFQNGPQRVYVTLAYTPWIYRLRPDREATGAGSLETHTGAPVNRIQKAWMDETGSLLLLTGHGIGVLDDRDLLGLSPAFRDRAGGALDDARLAERIERAMQDADAGTEQDTGIALAHGGTTCSVASLPSAAAPQRFGFDPRPAPRE
ncbi:MAG TPA: DUF2946 family protein [Gammaproteobacteria bacterium]|nr:DUF2946 family protein [Gammaproteobacteria bacterium]